MHVVSGGRQALDFLQRKGEYADRERAAGGELVLLDLGLPDIGGLEVLGQIKSNPETRSTPVVMLTASNVGDDIKESFRLGAAAYIVKPVTFQAFLDAVRQAEIGWTLTGLVRRAATSEALGLPLDRAADRLGLGRVGLLAGEQRVERGPQPGRVLGRVVVVGVGRAAVAQQPLRIDARTGPASSWRPTRAATLWSASCR